MLLLINVLLLVSQILPGMTIDVQVETDIGTIIGHTKDIHFNGTRYTVREFLGIPFAEAPIGPLRFAKPVKKAPFTEPYIAQTASPLCPQNPQYLAFLGITGGLENQVEDCLTLNVFTPDRPVRGKKLPVLVWIHGGFYEVQTQDYFLGKMLPATQDIIFVTMNYRLTVLGFLSTGNGSELPENNGLWDQHLALKWVQDHIECFGGDPGKVTIAGNSAGSMSSVHHALYRGSKGLFRSVIAHSGTANNLARLEDKPFTKFLAIANATGCMASSQGEMIECLRNLPLAALIAKTTIDLYYAPVVDGEFIELHPDEVFANNSTKAHNILCHYGMYNIIYGLNSDEANAYMRPVDYAVAVGTDVIAGYTLDNFKNIVIPLILSENKISYSPSPELTEAIVELYLGDIDTSNNVQIREQTIDFLSDTIFNAGVIKSAQVHANTKLKGNTYLFIFHHRSIISKPGREGSTHGEENIFALGFPMVKLEYIYDITFTDPATVFTQEDLQLSLDMMTYWGNYVKTGNPNFGTHGHSYRTRTLWPEYTIASQRYILFDGGMDEFPIESHFVDERIDFWNNVVPGILGIPDGNSNEISYGTCPGMSEWKPERTFKQGHNHYHVKERNFKRGHSHYQVKAVPEKAHSKPPSQYGLIAMVTALFAMTGMVGK